MDAIIDGQGETEHPINIVEIVITTGKETIVVWHVNSTVPFLISQPHREFIVLI
jgi:hypothetical protein